MDVDPQAWRLTEILVDDDVVERMVRAAEKVRERMQRAARALEGAAIPYAVIGGNAVAIHVGRVDEAVKEKLRLSYKGNLITKTYEPDFVCFGKIIVEVKAVREIVPDHEAQLLNCLKLTGMKLGMLAKFGSYLNAQVDCRVL
jgi:GxxExxY protein